MCESDITHLGAIQMALSKNNGLEPPLPRYVRARELIDAGIVGSYTALDRLIRNHGFPSGILLSPNVRAWPVDAVQHWLTTRPHERRKFVPRKREIEAT
jgi:predicted DNA-binding transcriptional regulator AlpA